MEQTGINLDHNPELSCQYQYSSNNIFSDNSNQDESHSFAAVFSFVNIQN